MFDTVVVFRENKLTKFLNDSERREQVSIILSSVSYRMV